MDSPRSKAASVFSMCLCVPQFLLCMLCVQMALEDVVRNESWHRMVDGFQRKMATVEKKERVEISSSLQLRFFICQSVLPFDQTIINL